MVEQRPGGNPLVQLSYAAIASQRLGQLANQLIGHFVDWARRFGASCSTIGEAMGVTKQAAQQRFVPSLSGLDLLDRPLNRLTPRACRTIVAARREALMRLRGQVGTEHLLLGVLTQRKSEGAKILADLGITAERVREWILQTVDQVAATWPPAS